MIRQKKGLLTAKGYTKHYFEEGRRVCSKLGGWFLWRVPADDILKPVEEVKDNYEEQHNQQRQGVHETFGKCIGAWPELIDKYDLLKMLLKYKEEEKNFYYHSDHLGSAAYLTSGGDVTQTLNYLPYGEDWIDVQNNMDPRLGQYRFNGKEKDYESGFHYYGARYYWSEVLTGWLSIDPMSDKYPSISPYAYCAWNPVKLIDPDGRDTAFAGAAERALYLNYREKVFSDDKYKQVQNELIQLEQSSEVFCVRMGENISSSNGGGNFTYNTSTGQFDINIDDDGIWTDIEKLSHELKHADQYLNRKLTLLIDTKGHATFYNYSVDDELEAYNRQGMFGNTWTSEEVYQVYGKQKGLSWYDANRQYTPSSNDINVNAEYQKHLGHPRILYHGWENDVKQRQTR